MTSDFPLCSFERLEIEDRRPATVDEFRGKTEHQQSEKPVPIRFIPSSSRHRDLCKNGASYVLAIE